MSHHWLFINSPGYRRFIEATKQNRWLLWGTTALLAGAGAVAANLTMNYTNPNALEEGYKDKGDELAKLPMHSQLVAKNNRAVLKAMILDVTSGSDQARYKDMLNGRLHNTRHGTSMPDDPE